MILNFNGIFYGFIVLIIILVSVTTLIAYKKASEQMNKSFLGRMLILVGLMMFMVPLFVFEMLRFLLN